MDQQHDYPVKPVPFTAVRAADAFWAPRIATARTTTIPFAFEQCVSSGRVDNFRRAAAVLRGEQIADKTLPGFPFDDTDIYKVIEGAAYSLVVEPDPELEAYVDRLIEEVAAAQEPDGYLYTIRTIDPGQPNRWTGPERWVWEEKDSHELYNLGHLYEAAVAYTQATGKTAIMDISERTADLLDRTFGPGKAAIWPGHQITEMALVKLYRQTGNRRYLDLAKFMLDVRGPSSKPGVGRDYSQSHLPVVEQDEAVGHAVRAVYMYSGMADVAAMTGDSTYIAALDRLWDNVVGKKLYITGGIGSNPDREAFGPAYYLPNATAYSETCAAIGNVYWNQRMFLLHGDSRYIDVLERSLYNALMAGISLDGMAFFYDNPLESDGSHQRSPWFGCACCPSNLSRFLPSLAGYVYAQRDNAIYVNLFVGGSATLTLDDGRTVKLTQETNYPWDGKIRLTVAPDQPGQVAIKLRIPGWARGEVVSSDLYSFIDQNEEQSEVRLNGEPLALDLDHGYVTISRDWQPGDAIELTLPMPVRRIVANEQVEDDRGRVALQRGPLVYCLEAADNPGIAVRDLTLTDDEPLNAEYNPDLLGGIVTISGASGDQHFTAIPYYAWNNRGQNEMAIWLKRG